MLHVARRGWLGWVWRARWGNRGGPTTPQFFLFLGSRGARASTRATRRARRERACSIAAHSQHALHLLNLCTKPASYSNIQGATTHTSPDSVGNSPNIWLKTNGLASQFSAAQLSLLPAPAGQPQRPRHWIHCILLLHTYLWMLAGERRCKQTADLRGGTKLIAGSCCECATFAHTHSAAAPPTRPHTHTHTHAQQRRHGRWTRSSRRVWRRRCGGSSSSSTRRRSGRSAAQRRCRRGRRCR